METFISSLEAKGLPFVLFRHPKEEHIHCYYQKDKQVHRTSTFEEDGFVFNSFAGETSSLYIPATNQKAIVFQAPKKRTSSPPALPLNGKVKFEESVTNAVKEINATKLEKVVLSAPFSVPNTRDAVSIFTSLEHKYPNAFVYYWSHSETGNWLGATPERFVFLDEKQMDTMALAGTLPAGATQDEWTEKEYHEQELVTQSIINALKKVVPLGAIKVGERQTVPAGKLQHLQTPIRVYAHDILLRDVIKVLHPTPAIGGLPVVKAQAFIREYEGYDREFYAGFLGVFKQNKSAKLFVNLRCGKVTKNSIQLFAGAGITNSSDPGKEWNEICRKAMTFLSVI